MTHWPHAPKHVFNSKGSYIVTGATLNKYNFFKTTDQLDLLETALFNLSQKYNWPLEAWAIFPNHYHFIAQSPDEPSSLRKFITHFHASTAKQLNYLENKLGRRIWYQYWDTQLTYEKSYLARLNYVMNNPVKHKIVLNAEEYKWCSAGWFARNALTAHQKVVASFKTDCVNIYDDY